MYREPLDQPAQNALVPTAENALDVYGFDPGDYNWIPVARQRRPDGWSYEKQRAFIEALADSGSITAAAKEVGMSITSCYRLRRSPGAESFAAAWEAAIGQASKRLVEVAFDRALNGVEEPVFDRYGEVVSHRTKHNDRLLMFLLRAHNPERYARAHQAISTSAEPPVPPPMAEALATLLPAPPPLADLLLDPGGLETKLQVADLSGDFMGDKLPHYYSDLPKDDGFVPLSRKQERELEALKHMDYYPAPEGPTPPAKKTRSKPNYP